MVPVRQHLLEPVELIRVELKRGRVEGGPPVGLLQVEVARAEEAARARCASQAAIDVAGGAERIAPAPAGEGHDVLVLEVPREEDSVRVRPHHPLLEINPGAIGGCEAIERAAGSVHE